MHFEPHEMRIINRRTCLLDDVVPSIFMLEICDLLTESASEDISTAEINKLKKSNADLARELEETDSRYAKIIETLRNVLKTKCAEVTSLKRKITRLNASKSQTETKYEELQNIAFKTSSSSDVGVV